MRTFIFAIVIAFEATYNILQSGEVMLAVLACAGFLMLVTQDILEIRKGLIN